MYQRVIFGKVTREENKNLKDVSWRERIILFPTVVLIFWIGIYPKPFLERIEPAVKQVLYQVDQAATVETDDDLRFTEKMTNRTTDTTVVIPFLEGEPQ